MIEDIQALTPSFGMSTPQQLEKFCNTYFNRNFDFINASGRMWVVTALAYENGLAKKENDQPKLILSWPRD